MNIFKTVLSAIEINSSKFVYYSMKLLMIIGAICATTFVQAQNWDQLTNFQGGSRDDGCSFTIDGIAYCGTGRDAGFAVTSDFYAFDLNTEQWTQVGGMPFPAKRQYATAVTYNSEAYVFGGINDQGDYLTDMWRYTPVSNSWSYMGQAPFDGRSGMQSFVLYDVLYIVGGRTMAKDAVNEVWAYEFSSGLWSMQNDMPNAGVWRGIGLASSNIGIIGMGSDSTNTKRGEFYFYDPLLDVWTEMVQLETEPMSYPAAGVINDRLFIYGGEDTLGVYRNDFRYLDFTNLTWNTMNSFPQEARRGAMAFTSNSDFYITTGLTTTQRLDETWVARSVANVDESVPVSDLAIYAVDGVMFLPDQLEKCSLFNSMGQYIPLTAMESGVFGLPKWLPPGMYFCQGMEDGQMLQGKLVIH